jgi:hypothetical protein
MAAITGTTIYAGFWRRFAAWFLDGLLVASTLVVKEVVPSWAPSASPPLPPPPPTYSG